MPERNLSLGKAYRSAQCFVRLCPVLPCWLSHLKVCRRASTPPWRPEGLCGSPILLDAKSGCASSACRATSSLRRSAATHGGFQMRRSCGSEHVTPIPVERRLDPRRCGVAAGLYLCNVTEPWANCRDDFGPMFRIGALGAGIGIGVDALIRGRTTIYERERGAARLQAAPIVGRHAGGLQVSLSFLVWTPARRRESHYPPPDERLPP